MVEGTNFVDKSLANGELTKENLDKFLQHLDYQLHSMMGNDNAALYMIGGESLLYTMGQTTRLGHDIDFAVGHGPDRYTEGHIVQAAFGKLGFKGSGTYDPTSNQFYALQNVGQSPGNKALKITKIDICGGEKPKEAYPMDWITEHSAPVSVNGKELHRIAALQLPALAVRKLNRYLEGDKEQKHDLYNIYMHVRKADECSDVKAQMQNAWEWLMDANGKDVSFSRAFGYFSAIGNGQTPLVVHGENPPTHLVRPTVRKQ